MLDVALVGLVCTVVVMFARRTVWGAPPQTELRLAVVAAVAVAIQAAFHAAAIVAPTAPSAAAAVVAAWTLFGLWIVWVSRTPVPRVTDGHDEDGGGEDGGDDGGGGGPDDGPPPRDDGDVDWDRFERDFAGYVERQRRTAAPR